MQLEDSIQKHFRVNEKEARGLKRLRLETIKDLLFYFPSRYGNISEIKSINQLVEGENATIYGKFWSPNIKRSFKSKIVRATGEVIDETGKIKVMWFNQPYIAKMLHSGEMVELTGKVTSGKGGLYFANPEFKKMTALPIDVHDSLFSNTATNNKNVFGIAVYAETRYVTSKWLYHAIQKVIKSGLVQTIDDYIPEEILRKYSLPKLTTALMWIHAPQSENDAQAARKRFAFEEVFFIQLQKQQERKEFIENKSYAIQIDDTGLIDFVGRFPFEITNGQERAISHITDDIIKPHPMARLLEGDVGSGKTAVAASAAYAIIKNRPTGQTFGNLQVAYMAPTEILATQLFENFINYFEHTGISIGLITGSGCRKFPSKVASAGNNWTTISRPQLLKWVANGEIPILVGTHALIQKSVQFKHLALVIIDEQHRFGTIQRSKLAKKEGFAPHLLSMTATPIPRTLALTIYGDLDLTILDEMPPGRKHVITEIVSPNKRGVAYEAMRRELKSGRQLYVICPRIDEPDPDKELALQAKSVASESKRLAKEVFPEYKIGILHSKMSKEKKEAVMQDFASHKIDILVATSVVEVGVNVPNATVIIIEGAERFGLAQLHQLRGRVMRSTDQAYCYLFAEAKTQKTVDRLRALVTAKNGFELAELDLTLRGAGELGGLKQWGISDLGMEAIKNIKMVEAARTEATTIIEKDQNIDTIPLLQKELAVRKLDHLHFE